MQRKFWVVLLAIVATLCMAFGLAACGGESANTGNTDGNQNEPHEHSFTNYVFNDDATCLEDGTETATCSCGEKDTRTKKGSALGHDYQQCEEKEPTCSEAGNKSYEVCRRCNDSTLTKEDYIPALHVQYQIGNGNYTVMGLSDCTETEIVIPSSYMGKPVITIGEGAFAWCGGLTSVTIPDGVDLIGKDSFMGCSGLTSVNIGNGVTSIGYEAFDGCSNLKEVHFENPNGWKVSEYSNMTKAINVSGLNEPATAARYLTDDYCDYDWKRG